MFLKSQRKWENPPLQNDHRDKFKALCCEHTYDAARYGACNHLQSRFGRLYSLSSYSHVLPHGSYLVNLAQEDAEKATQAYNAFLDDLHRCESLYVVSKSILPSLEPTREPWDMFQEPPFSTHVPKLAAIP